MNALPLLALMLNAVTMPAATPATDGGVFSTPQPVVGTVQCSRRCPSVTAVTPGTSTVRIQGRNLGSVAAVRFLGARGSRDDRSGTATAVSATGVDVEVPAGMTSGPVRAVTSGGQTSTTSRSSVRVAPQATAHGNVDAAADAPSVVAGGAQRPTLRFLVRDGSAVRIDLVRGTTGTPLVTWSPPTTDPGTVQVVRWSGKIGHATAGGGRYAFRISPTGSAVSTSSGTSTVPFVLLRDVFPVVGAHRIDMGAGRFGAGRGGHTHQGQDVFARCGTTMVAARGGKIQVRTFQGLAGNYVVVDVDDTAQDDVYAHLKAPGLLKVGQRVVAGQRIGQVGDTGDAEGCHLHFEIWSAPGWYQGGKPLDPLPSLRKWDAAG